jgi:hypothetical protein
VEPLRIGCSTSVESLLECGDPAAENLRIGCGIAAGLLLVCCGRLWMPWASDAA